MHPRLGSEKPGDTGAADAFPWEAHYPARMDWRATVPQRPLFAILDEAAERFAERPFLDFIGRRYSYAEAARGPAPDRSLAVARQHNWRRFCVEPTGFQPLVEGGFRLHP
ncbi:MAG: dicarboxylate--CoA ligase PimA [Thermomicrobiales bacterium]|nr:dicarboxylate--CoA ligase PimA [Thermomicrobiales bacterium]